jgi:ergothioneine biosynthesis protein EgtB
VHVAHLSISEAMATVAHTSGLNIETLRERYAEVRNTSMRVTRDLSPEDHMLQSMPDASPAKWHLAHTTWFFETFILQPQARNYKTFDPRFTYLFNSYYKQLGSHPYRGARGLMSRPDLATIHAYRVHVDHAIKSMMDHFDSDTLALLELGLNHEQQHQELILTDVKHALWSGPLRPEMVEDDLPEASIPPLKWISLSGGIHKVGYAGDDFSFDNERPRHEVLLRPFELASRAVTNGEYLQFMADGGYRRPELWLSDGWDAVNNNQWESPLYWERDKDGSWWSFANPGMKRVNMAEPVCHVSYYEADAYAHWAGQRLPREEEWEVAAVHTPSAGTMLEEFVLHPEAAEGEGLQQMFGDVWEWTASAYLPYPGFAPAPGLVGEYNGKFMSNQMVLRGGSCATPASHIRATYRNFFPPHARWQFSGIRTAK